MQLEKYLEENNLSVAEFAKQIGARSRVTVYRYIKRSKRRIPEPEMMQRIIEATGGLVTANDFHQLSENNLSTGTINGS